MAAAFRCAFKRGRPAVFSVLLVILSCSTIVSSVTDVIAGQFHRPHRLELASDRHQSVSTQISGKAGDPAWNFGASAPAGLDGEVFVIVDYLGGIVAAGDFMYADSEFVNGIAMFDGENWQALGSGVVGEIYSMYVLGDLLYVGGEFTEIGGQAASNLAAWDGESWIVDVASIDGPVFKVGSNVGKVAIVGDFSEVDGYACNQFACKDGNWTDYGFPGTWKVESIYEDISIVGVEPDVEIYYTLFLGGENLASLDNSGIWVEYQVDGFINDIQGFQGFMVAGGLMDLVDGAPCDNSIAWNGSNWVEFGSSDYEILDLCVVKERLYAAGRPIWNRAELDVASRFRIQIKGPETWDPLRSTPVPNGPVNTICALSDSLIAGGMFDGFYSSGGDMINGFYSPNIAMYSGLWGEYGVARRPLGFDHKVRGSLVMDDKMVFYGNFMTVNDDIAGGTAFFDGINWTTKDHGPVDPQSFDPDLFFRHNYAYLTLPFQPGYADTMMAIRERIHDVRGIVKAITYRDALYVAGDFYFTDGDNIRNNFRDAEERLSISRIMGSSWILPNTSLFPPVADMAVYDDLLLFVSQGALGVASYNDDNGVVNRNIYPVTFPISHIYNHNDELFISAEGGIYRLDQSWVPLGDQRMAHALFFPVGDEIWASPVGGEDGLYILQGDIWERAYAVNGNVMSVLSYNGDLFIAGNFDSFDNRDAEGLVYIRGNQVVVPESGMTLRDGSVGTITSLTNFYGNMMVGGLFDLVGNVESPNLARWNNDFEAPILTVGIHQNPYTTQLIDIYVMGDDSPLLPTDMVFQISEEDVLIEPLDDEGQIWRSEYTLGADETDYTVTVSAVDYSWLPTTVELPFTAKAMTRDAGGSLKSSDGVLKLNIAADVLDHDTTFLVSSGDARLENEILKIEIPAAREAIDRTYSVSPAGALAMDAEVVFSLDDLVDPRDAASVGWHISRPDGTLLETWYDPGSNTVRTFTRELGSFKLAYDGQLPVALYDNAFLRVAEARPNPFNPQTRIDFEIKAKGHVNADVYDVMGRRVCSLLNAEVLPGTHQLVWTGTTDSGKNASSGIYMVKISAADQQVVRKITLLK